MTNTFKIDAALTTQSQDGTDASGIWQDGARLLETVGIQRSTPLYIELPSNDPVDVALPPGFSGAHAVAARVVGGSEVTMECTSYKGVNQAVPVDPLALVLSKTTPFTAFRLTRTPGVTTFVSLWLGEKDGALGQINPVSTTVGVHKLYIRPDGSDTEGDGLTEDTAFATLPYVFDLMIAANRGLDIPSGVYYDVDVTGCTLDLSGYEVPQFRSTGGFSFDFSAAPGRVYLPVSVYATPTPIDGGTIEALSAPDTVNAGSGLYSVNSDLTLTADQFAGKLAVGAGYFETAPIRGNTAGADSVLELAVDYSFTLPIAVCEPGATITGLNNDGATMVFNGGSCGVYFFGIKFRNTAGSNSKVAVALGPSGYVLFDTCDIGGIEVSGNRTLPWSATSSIFASGKEARWDGSGHNLYWCLITHCNTVKNGVSGGMASGGFQEWRGCIADSCGDIGSTGSGNTSLAAISISKTQVYNAGIQLRGGPGMHELISVVVDDAPSIALLIIGKAQARITHLTGSGSAAGIVLRDGGYAIIDATSAITSTTPGAELKAGSNTAITLAAARLQAGGVEVATDQSIAVVS